MKSLHPRMLRYLDEVARAGSIRKAAARLNIAASSINRQILALEEEAGVPLFERLPNRLRMTAAGEAVLAHVRRTLADLDRTLGHLQDLRGMVQICQMPEMYCGSRAQPSVFSLTNVDVVLAVGICFQSARGYCQIP